MKHIAARTSAFNVSGIFEITNWAFENLVNSVSFPPANSGINLSAPFIKSSEFFIFVKVFFQP